VENVENRPFLIGHQRSGMQISCSTAKDAENPNFEQKAAKIAKTAKAEGKTGFKDLQDLRIRFRIVEILWIVSVLSFLVPRFSDVKEHSSRVSGRPQLISSNEAGLAAMANLLWGDGLPQRGGSSAHRQHNSGLTRAWQVEIKKRGQNCNDLREVIC
jgi:hypothetical protein